MSYTQGELELELTVAKFKMVAMADSAFVAGQWALAITDGILSKGLFLDPSAPEAGAGSGSPTSETAAAAVAADPFSPVQPPPSPPPPPPPSSRMASAVSRLRPGAAKHADTAAAAAAVAAAEAAAAASAVRRPWSVDEGDLLGDLAAAAESGESVVDEGLQRDLEELLGTAQPTARLDAAHSTTSTTTSPRPACVQVPVGGTEADMLGGGLGGGGLGDMLDMDTPPRSSAAARSARASSSDGRAAQCTAAPCHAAPSIWSGAEASLLDLMDTPAAAGHRRGPSAGAVLAPDVFDAPAAPRTAASSLDDDFLRSLVGAASGEEVPVVPMVPPASCRSTEAAGVEGGLALRIHKHAAGAKLGLTLRSAEGVVEVLAVAEGSVAAAAGLLVGQRLLSVEGVAVQTSEDAGAHLSLALARAAASVLVRVRPPAVERLPSGVQAACRAAADARTNGGGAAERPSGAASAGGDRLGGDGGGGSEALRCSGLNISGVKSVWGRSGYSAAGAAAEGAPPPPSDGGGGEAGGFAVSGFAAGAEDEVDEEDAPSAPSMPFAEGSGETSLDVAWQMPAWAHAEAVRCFELEWQREGDEAWHSTPASRALTARRAATSGLLPASAYWVRVRAMGRDGRASPFSRSLLPALTAPAPPEAFPLDDGVVSVNFLPVQCAARYELQWRQHAPPPAAPRPWETSEASQHIRGTTVNKRNLPTGQRFEFRVRAFTEDGAASPLSAPSEWVRVGDPVEHFEERERERNASIEADAAAAAAEAVAVSSSASSVPAASAKPPSEAHLAQLQELGLDRTGALRALRETGGSSVAAAADWYFANYTPDAQPARPADDVSWLLG